MLNRNIESSYGDYAGVYENIVDEAKKSFKALGKELTVFHQILIDKVADSYVATLMVGDDTNLTDPKKVKSTAAELQKWLGMALQEERNAEAATQAKRAFYEKVIGIIEDKVPDDTQRRDILKGIRDVVEE